MKMSDTYTQMIYVAVATMHLYSKNIVVSHGMTVEQFRENYSKLCKRVFDEVLSIYNYELSFEQMNRSIYAYMSGVIAPQDVDKTEVFANNNAT